MSSKFALIIGNSHYQDPNLAKLVAPTEDVNDLAVVLRDPAIGSFDQVVTLIDETDAAIRLSIEDFFAEKKPDDLLVLYFSGHGVRDEQGRLYLAAPNTRANRLRATAIAADFITTEMDRSRSKRQVLILDCCHSGAFAQGSKAVTGGTVGVGPAFEGTGYGRVVLTATDATQYAWEGDQIIGEADNSVFTHYLVQGLQTGEADVDADGRITLDELYDYVYGQVVAKTPKQTPGKWSYKQQGDMIIARNPKPIVKPAELPADLRTAIESPLANVRAGAVRELDRLLNGSNASLVLAASEAIKHLIDDDSRSVSQVASSVLNVYAEKQRVREEQERLAKEQAEQAQLAKAKAEAERQAALKAEQDRIAAERAEAERQAALKADADRQAAIKAEQDRIATERAEAERQAALKAEADRQAAINAEQDRIDAERAEAERQAALKAEADRRAAIKAEQDRIAAERAEAERQAALKAEADRQAAIKAEQDRIAAERAQAERQAAIKAEQDRLAAEKAEQERIARAKAEAERQAALKAEQDRLAVEPVRPIEEIGDTARRPAISTARLIVQSGPNAGQTFVLQTGVNTIGRTGRATIQLADRLISRQHVRLNVEAKRVTLEDLGSANGTFVNAQRANVDTPVVLHDGDTIAVGDTVLVFQTKAAAPSVQPAEPQPALLVGEETFIAETPPKSFADQLVADQSTRLSSAVSAQPSSDSQRILQLIARPTLIVAVGFGVIFGLWFGLLMNVQDSVSVLALTAVAITLMWLTVGLVLRQLQMIVSWQRIFAVAAGWAIAAGLGTGVAYALGNALFYERSPDFLSLLFLLITLSVICGLVGGQLTGRILHSPLPALRLKTTTWGWTIAWIVGGCAFMVLGWDKGSETAGQMLGLSGALIGAIGGGTMFWQIAQRRESASVGAPIRDLKLRIQPIGSAIPTPDISTGLRAIGIICGGWVALELLIVLVAQSAHSAGDTATYIILSFGAGCLVLGFVLQRAVPSMQRTAWLLAGGWALASIGAVQIGVVAQLDSNWLSVTGAGICGLISAWAVFRETPSVPRWQYVAIGVVWMLAYALGSGYAWYMVVYKAQHDSWSLAETMNALEFSVFTLILGAILSSAIGGLLMYFSLKRAQKPTQAAQGSTR